MKKILSGLIVCLFLMLGFGSASACPDNTTSLNKISINSILDEQGYTIFDATINCNGGAWIEFNDGTGFVLEDGHHYLYHQYPADKTYKVSVFKDKNVVCQTEAVVKGRDIRNQIISIANDFNKLKINVYCKNKTTLYWGDGTSVVLPKGTGQIVNHDYAYNVGSSKPYTLTLGSGYDIATATFTINDVSKTSTFTTTGSSEITKIVDWTPSNKPYIPTVSINDWKIGNTVVLPLSTEIRESAGTNYKILNLVQNSYWLAKVVDGPKNINNYTWWKIKLANGQTGWIRQDLANPSNLFEKTD